MGAGLEKWPLWPLMAAEPREKPSVGLTFCGSAAGGCQERKGKEEAVRGEPWVPPSHYPAGEDYWGAGGGALTTVESTFGPPSSATTVKV